MKNKHLLYFVSSFFMSSFLWIENINKYLKLILVLICLFIFIVTMIIEENKQ